MVKALSSQYKLLDHFFLRWKINFVDKIWSVISRYAQHYTNQIKLAVSYKQNSVSEVWLHYKQKNSLRKRTEHNNHRPRLFLLPFRSLNYLSRSPECYSIMLLDYSLTLLSFHPRLAFLLYEKTFPAHFSCKTPFPLRTLFKLVLLFIYTRSGSTIWTVSETVLDPAARRVKYLT